MTKDKLAQQITQNMRKNEGMSPALNLEYIDGGVGWAKTQMRVRDDMLNGLNTCHGGFIFTLADTAFAYACNSYNKIAFAHHASITFLSPGKLNEVMTAEAHEDAKSGRSGVYTVKVTGEDQRTIAIFQGLSRSIDGQNHFPQES